MSADGRAKISLTLPWVEKKKEQKSLENSSGKKLRRNVVGASGERQPHMTEGD
jgi:hypothetical protein